MSRKSKRNKGRTKALNQAKKSFNTDGFANALTGVGMNYDPGTSTYWSRSVSIQRETLNDMYAENKLFAKCIDTYPDDALRKGIDFNHDLADEIRAELKRLKLFKHLRRGGKREALHGGCAIYIDIDDGLDADQPVNLNGIKGIKELILLEAHYIYPVDYSRSSESELYQVNCDALNLRVHRERLLIFPGIEISDDYAYSNGGWGESKGRRLLKPIRRRESILNNIESLSGRMVIPVWQMDGLNDLVDDDDNQTIKERMQARLLGESMVHSVVIDGMDKFNMVSVNLTGLKELLAPADKDIVQASDIVHTKLFGESPGASLGATGGSQERDHNKSISGYQEDKMRDHIQRVLDLIIFLLKSNEPVDFTFNPLDEPTLLDMAKVHTEQAKADQVYEAMDVLSVEEIRESRFGGGEYSVNTKLDEAAYKGALEAAINDAMKGLENDEDPIAEAT